MPGIRDVIARMATDAAFAERVRSHPDEIAQQYGLSPAELAKVRGLAATDPGAGPSALGPRLSKSGIGTGGMVSLLASIGEAVDVPAEQQQGPTPPAAKFEFNPQPEPPEPIPMPDDGPPPPGGTEPASDDMLVGEQVGFGQSEVGYYPWPNAPEDPFPTMGEEGASYAQTALGGASAPGEQEGIIIVNTLASGEEEGITLANAMPAPGAAEGIIVIGSSPAPDDSGPAADDDQPIPDDDKGIIIVNSSPADGDGEMIIDDGKAPADAGDDMIIDDGDSQSEPAPVKIATTVKVSGRSSSLGSQEPYAAY